MLNNKVVIDLPQEKPKSNTKKSNNKNSEKYST